MDLDFLYSCVMDSTWFFLATWLLVLLGACMVAFRQDWPGVAGELAPSKAPSNSALTGHLFR